MSSFIHECTSNNNVFALGPASYTFSVVIEYNSVSSFQDDVLLRNNELNKDMRDSTGQTLLSSDSDMIFTATRSLIEQQQQDCG